MKCIRVWPFYKAPEEYQALSNNGGDEDWVVEIPKDWDEGEYISWLERIDTCNSPQRCEHGDFVIYIGAHA